MISNLTFRDIDGIIDSLVKNQVGTYTRYSDDLTISFDKFALEERKCIKKIAFVIKKFGFAVNRKKKIKVIFKHNSQRVLGLVVNERLNLPRYKRRLIRSMKYNQEKLPAILLEKDKMKLLGLLTWQNHIEKQKQLYDLQTYLANSSEYSV